MNSRKEFVLATLVFLASTASLYAQPMPTFYVDGRFLYDGCGEKVILRGTDVMTAYWDNSGAVTFPQLSQTGANCARIFWRAGDSYLSPTHLNNTIQNCINEDMIPMVGLWNATGEWAQLQTCVDYWTSPAVVAVVQDHEQYFLLNIANEAGNGDQSDAEWLAAYQSAITQIRNAGIICPLVIDPAGWGRDESYIFNNGPTLVAHDPLHNIIFDWHPWDALLEGGTRARIKNAINTSIDLDLCMIIGEFSHIGVDLSRRIEWEYMIQYATEHDIGWMPWVWWCCGDAAPKDGHSLVYDKIFGHWNLPWGQELSLNSQYSILNTAVRPASIVNGSCGAPVYTARKPLPADAVSDAPRNTNLHWHPGHGATSYDVYLGTDPTEVTAADTDSYMYLGNIGGTAIDIGTLPYDTTYYWAVDSVNDTSVFGRNVWQFTTETFDPNIIYDRSDNNYNNWGSSSVSFDHLLGEGDNRIVVVGLAAEDESASNLNVSYVRYNGVDMTPVPGSTATVGTTMLQRTDLYYILESSLPANGGYYEVRVQRAGGANEQTAGAISLFNVAQQAPEAVATNTNSDTTSISTGITTLTDNAWIVDVVGCGEAGMIRAGSEPAGMRRRWIKEGGYGAPQSSAAASTMPVASAGAATVTWNATDNADQTDLRLAQSLAVFAVAAPTYRIGDLNLDHAVDALDVKMLCNQWLDTGDCSANPGCADLDASLTVDFEDFALFSEDYRQ